MAVVIDGDRVYAVMDVIKARQSGINEECDEEDDQDEITSRTQSYSLTSVSKRMIDQFFTEVEGPDRDWQQDDDYDDMFGEDDLPSELMIVLK